MTDQDRNRPNNGREQQEARDARDPVHGDPPRKRRNAGQLVDTALQDLIRKRLLEFEIGPGTAERIAGLPNDTIRNVLRGRSPSYKTLLAICNALELRVTIEPVSPAEPPLMAPATTAPPSEDQPSEAARRQKAKNAVRSKYQTSDPREEIVNYIRSMPQAIVAEVIDEMVAAQDIDDAEELRDMAFEAGHTIW